MWFIGSLEGSTLVEEVFGYGGSGLGGFGPFGLVCNIFILGCLALPAFRWSGRRGIMRLA
jgi:hypothetical protein